MNSFAQETKAVAYTRFADWVMSIDLQEETYSCLLIRIHSLYRRPAATFCPEFSLHWVMFVVTVICATFILPTPLPPTLMMNHSDTLPTAALKLNQSLYQATSPAYRPLATEIVPIAEKQGPFTPPWSFRFDLTAVFTGTRWLPADC